MCGAMVGGKITIELSGTPVPKGRPRFARGHVYTPAATASYERSLSWAAKIAMGSRKPLEGPLRITVTAFVAIPKSFSRADRLAALAGKLWPRPDADNFLKTGLDACNGIVYEDDAQAVEVIGRKAFAIEPMMRVEIEPLIDSQEDSDVQNESPQVCTQGT